MSIEVQMTGHALRQARTNAGMTQVEAAARFGVSQTLLSLMETGERSVTPAVAELAVKHLQATPEELPLSFELRHSDDQLAGDLGALGYPGFGYLRSRLRNPAEVLFDALDRPDLDARLVEALPWLPLEYPNMDWSRLTVEAKLRNRQNRLGFVVALAAKVAKRQAKHDVAQRLSQVVKTLEEARLAKADTLCQESWPPSQREFAHKQRSALAAHWNLDTRLTEENLAHVAA
jgi:transcriptional regulator with XRE-family HTH domain